MAQFLASRSSGSRRLRAHAIALAAVFGAVFVGAATASPVVDIQVATAPTSDRADVAPAQVPLPLGPPLSAPAVPTLTARGAAVFDPRLGLPQWLRTARETVLWSGADPTAAMIASLPAGNNYVKPLGGFVDSRVQVYFPGDQTLAATQAWVDAATVEPSSLPSWLSVPSAGSVSALTGLPRPPQRINDAPAPYTTAGYVAIVDEDSGQLLYGESPHVPVPQASTTKIATTIVALERSPDLSRRIRATVSAMAMVARDGSSTMGIEPGRSVSLGTLLHGMMLPSGNDAAEQVALALADSREQYVEWMNQEAAALGLSETHFANPSGMDAAGHYSSAYDMAMLARYAMRNAAFREIVGASRYSGDGYAMYNLNRFLDLYPGADGIKIGFTDAAQKTIVASAVHNGHRVYVSLMRSQDLVGDSTTLFDWVWDTFAW